MGSAHLLLYVIYNIVGWAQTLQHIKYDIIGASKLYIKLILSCQLISADIYDIIALANEYIICDITGWAHDI